MIPKDYLEHKLVELQEQFKQCEANLNATSGAIQFCQMLLQECDKAKDVSTEEPV